VSVAIRFPVATNCGVPDELFCTEKLLMLKVPAIVPLLPNELRALAKGPEVVVKVPVTGTDKDVCP
jgi:hypothetical protein